MGIMKLFSVFKDGWERMDEPPEWVKKAYGRWKSKLPTHPYNMTKHFAGKTFIYRVKHGQGMQGEAPVLEWARKLKE